jgi:DNA mismatch repair protein MutL
VEDEREGARLKVEGGISKKLAKVGTTVGTTIRVEDLFYNVPARLKFLKTDVTERRAIDSLVTRYALAYPEKRFKLSEGRNAILQTAGDGDRRAILAALYGVDVARQMLEIMAEEDGYRLSGFISPVSLTRSNRREITFFVNGRPVQDSALISAVLQAYHTLLMVGRFPLGTLFLEMDPEAVDVNVHPTKAEVRFRDASRAFTGVQRAVRRALLAHTPVPGLEHTQLRWTPEPSWQGEPQRVDLAWQMAHSPTEEAAASEASPADQPVGTTPAQAAARLGMPLLRLVGQVASAYIIAEGPDGLYLIDQHAAHERVLFERFMALRQQAGKAIPAQSLLQPQSVSLPPASARLLENQLGLLNSLGFQVEPFGPGAFLVRGIPALLSGLDPAAALRVLVEDFEEDEAPLQAEIEARLVARVCKRAAVKAGHTLSTEEQRALLNDLEACTSPRTCPHGRPTMIHLSVDLLERQFGRKGAR